MKFLYFLTIFTLCTNISFSKEEIEIYETSNSQKYIIRANINDFVKINGYRSVNLKSQPIVSFTEKSLLVNGDKKCSIFKNSASMPIVSPKDLTENCINHFCQTECKFENSSGSFFKQIRIDSDTYSNLFLLDHFDPFSHKGHVIYQGQKIYFDFSNIDYHYNIPLKEYINKSISSSKVSFKYEQILGCLKSNSTSCLYKNVSDDNSKTSIKKLEANLGLLRKCMSGDSGYHKPLRKNSTDIIDFDISIASKKQLINCKVR